jgi:SAM-dependent methyltransferase
VTEPKRSLAFDRVADEYDRTRGGPQRGESAAAALLPLLPAAGPVLEIGVGTGLVAAALTRHGRDVVGVDLSARMLAHAQERLPGRVLVGDGLRLPVASGAVAATVFVHVLHLVADVGGTLAEAARVLRPGGRVVASVGPDRDDGPPTDVGEILTELARGLGVAGGSWQDGESAVLAAAGQCGLTVVQRGGYRPAHLPITPAETINRIGTRSWSWMWRADDAEFARLAEPAMAALRRLPDQDRVRPDDRALPILAFELSH